MASPKDKVIAGFPATFGLRAFPGARFRISARDSYVNDAGILMLYTEIERDGEWQSFGKGTEEELRAEVVGKKAKQQRERGRCVVIRGPAADIAEMLGRNADLVASRAITWDRFGTINRAIWQDAERLGLADAVKAILRHEEGGSDA